MKKLCTVLLLTFLYVTTSFAQQSQDTLRLKQFSTWAIAPYLSVPSQFTDIEPISLSTRVPGFGVNLEKHLSHFTSLQLGYSNTPLGITKDQTIYKINIQQYDARFYIHITNGNTLRNWRSTQLYMYSGIGKLYHETTIDNAGVSNTTNGNAVVALVGGGAKYRVGGRTAMFVDGCGNFTNSDKIDGTKMPYSFNDGYFKLSVGVTYTFGKKRMIEWDNPYHYLVPEEVHDTLVILKTIKYEQPKTEVVWPDSATIYYISKSTSIEVPYLSQLDSLIDNAINTDAIREIIVSAYCDTLGSDVLNKAIVLKRGNVVANYINAEILKRTGTDVSLYTAIILYDEGQALYAPDARNRKVVVTIRK